MAGGGNPLEASSLTFPAVNEALTFGTPTRGISMRLGLPHSIAAFTFNVTTKGLKAGF